jgi:RimJ/RimL family protein N-acetyltransferase
MDIEPVTLEGRHVRLEALALDHLDALCRVGFDESIWRWMPYSALNEADMRRYIETALKQQAAGWAVPFATVKRSSGRVVGSTRYMNIDKPNRRVEIGSTWIGVRWQRTAVNTEAKYLMLRHAFETLGCIRVEFKTDALNEKSRRALLRIGARQEGVFRKHMLMPDGRVRDSVYFSIIDTEWPVIKTGLENRLSQPYLSKT